ncbi:[citrate (pro-3S)-lyase] ligase [Periweissella beninensis]|uniref:[Citrate [pro-3S]-lyase] ligase n=1 Tax=Periweissella beninensis TaxID=504936 RepID=A0ABT0VFK4_9LACO|nr:[citrate (pro-3S)-lyase] ligase [Periweissella beninensis]MBM7543623.1 [citrate (pro-3S)-lyase] ligase [Periweissella beninensis]MCM2436603.1 [citrate (pro-3S)-lyase] ligase [Periweissella beninensis]MCT4395573.1 [citrate (pro-3S)-lyase] ligase [Periweissella beninensis]
MPEIESLDLNKQSVKIKWQNFLKKRGISNFADNEITNIDTTIGLFEANSLIATGSIAGNVIKYVAVENETNESKGALFNKIVSALVSCLANQGIFHIFVFTKPEYSKTFEHVGFSLLATSEKGVILEKGMPDINSYLMAINASSKLENKKIASIVMNANPFTKGHRFLVEQAALENDLVYVFVVEQDVSLFTTNERVKLVKQGVSDLTNVKVVLGGPYMVSFVTFPAYFINSPIDIIDYQTTLDAQIFKNWVVPQLKITSRYLGCEPFSKTTKRYNEILQQQLSDVISIKIIERKMIDAQIISATKIRLAIKETDLLLIKELVPLTTFKFIKNNLNILQERIQKGQKINGN